MSVLELPDYVTDSGVAAGGQDWIAVPRERIRDALLWLRDQGYESHVMVTCVDHLATPVLERPPARFELVYQLRNMEARHEIRVRTYVPEDDAVAPSVQDIYAPANWDEREIWDMFGVRFDGHPDLLRILMPDDWEGHPLRRDFPVGGEPVDFSEDHEVWQTAPPEA